MEFATFTKTVRAGTPFYKGQMMNSWMFFDTPYRFSAIADTNRTPYFVYQEEGTIYFKGNRGFIRNGIVGQINKATWSESLGLPYKTEEINKTLNERNNSILISMGVLEVQK